MTHPVITQVTNRIRERSTARRARFLARIQRQADQGKTRASLSCGNLATPWPPRAVTRRGGSST